MKKNTLEDFIKKSQQIHNNKYDYSKVKYINNRTKFASHVLNMVNFGKPHIVIYLVVVVANVNMTNQDNGYY